MTSFYLDSNDGEIDYIGQAEAAAIAAQTAQTAAELAETGAEASEAQTLAYLNAAEAAKNAAEAAQVAAELAETNAELAETNSETAQAAAEAAQAAAEFAAASVPTFPVDAAGVLTNDGAGLLTWETVAGFDASANQTITGEYLFNLASSRSFSMNDDPTFAATTKAWGIFDHEAVNATAIFSATRLINTVGSSNSYYAPITLTDAGVSTSIVQLTNASGDYISRTENILVDGSASITHYIDNTTGTAEEVLDLDVAGYSSKSITTDEFSVTTGSSTIVQTTTGNTITAPSLVLYNSNNASSLTLHGAGAVNLYGDVGTVAVTATDGRVDVTGATGASKGVRNQVGNGSTWHIVGDGTNGDTYEHKLTTAGTYVPYMYLNKSTGGNATMKFGVGTTTPYGLTVTRQSTDQFVAKLHSANGLVEVSQDMGGVHASVNITANGSSGYVNITGKVVSSGLKTGTLASPPAGLVIGEIWYDTTTSADHPMVRISTVTT